MPNTIETVAPSSTTTTDKQDQNPSNDQSVVLSPDSAPKNGSSSSFSEALDRAQKSHDERASGTQKPDDKAKPTESQKAPDSAKGGNSDGKAPEGKSGDDKGKGLDSLPKLDSKKLLDAEKPEAKAKPSDKDKGKDTDEEPLTEEDLKEELNSPHRREKSQRRFRQLWTNWKNVEGELASTKKEIAARDAKLAAIEKQLKEAGEKAGVSDEVQKQLEELAMFRRQDELKNDPKIKVDFDDRISGAETTIMKILTERDSPLSKEYVDAIKSAGGFIAWGEKNPETAEEIFQRLSLTDRSKLQAAMIEQANLSRNKEALITTEKGKAKEYFEAKAKREAEEAANRPDPMKEAKVLQDRFNTWKEQVKKEAPDIFQPEDVPADASKAVREEINSRNNFKKQLSEALDQRVSAKTAEEWQDILLEAVLAHKFHADKKALQKKVAELEKELDEIRNAGRTVSRGGANTTPETKKSDGKVTPMSFEDRLSDVMEKRANDGPLTTS